MIRKRQITDRACIVMFLSVAAFATILLAVLGRGSAPTQRKKSNYSQTLQRISANKKTPPKRKAPRPKNIWVEARTEAFKKLTTLNGP